MIEVDICYGAQHREVFVVAILCFKKVNQSSIVPAVAIGIFAPYPERSSLSLELGQPDFLQNIIQSILQHLELPDNFSHHEIEISVEAVNAVCEVIKAKLDCIR